MKFGLRLIRLWLLIWCLPGIALLALMWGVGLIGSHQFFVGACTWPLGGIVVLGAALFR